MSKLLDTIEHCMDGYGGEAATPEELAKKARERNCYVVDPLPNEVYVDLDSPEARETFVDRLLIVQQHERVAVRFVESRQPGHCHAYVVFPRPIQPWERIALQAALGSDWKRELLACIQRRGSEPGPTVFFERYASCE